MEGKGYRQRVTKKLRMIEIRMPGSCLRHFRFGIYSILRFCCVLYIYICPLAYSNASSPQSVIWSILFQAAICLLGLLRSFNSCLHPFPRLPIPSIFPFTLMWQCRKHKTLWHTGSKTLRTWSKLCYKERLKVLWQDEKLRWAGDCHCWVLRYW